MRAQLWVIPFFASGLSTESDTPPSIPLCLILLFRLKALDSIAVTWLFFALDSTAVPGCTGVLCVLLARRAWARTYFVFVCYPSRQSPPPQERIGVPRQNFPLSSAAMGGTFQPTGGKLQPHSHWENTLFPAVEKVQQGMASQEFRFDRPPAAYLSSRGALPASQ